MGTEERLTSKSRLNPGWVGRFPISWVLGSFYARFFRRLTVKFARKHVGGRAVRAPDTRARAAHWAPPPPQPAATAAEEQLNFEAIAASDPEMSVAAQAARQARRRAAARCAAHVTARTTGDGRMARDPSLPCIW